VLYGKPLFNVTRPMQHYTIKAYEPSGLTVRHERNHKQWLGIESRA
jgi:hypothetical protein